MSIFICPYCNGHGCDACRGYGFAWTSNRCKTQTRTTHRRTASDPFRTDEQQQNPGVVPGFCFGEFMTIEKITTLKLTCDWCCNTDNAVRTYRFSSRSMDGHGCTVYDDKHIELCERCQSEAYEILKQHNKVVILLKIFKEFKQ